jgi:simple sugar transport system substrate-binding protein
MAVQWLEEELVRSGKAGEPLRILHIRGTDGATAQIGRTAALESAVRRHPEWEIAGVLPGEYTEAKSYELVRDFLKTDRDIDVIYSENDNMSFGAMRALDEAGLSYGTDGQIMLLSFDAAQHALQLCLEGKINACMECNPLHGPRVADLIRQMERGEQPEKQNYVKETLFSADTLTEDILQKREY